MEIGSAETIDTLEEPGGRRKVFSGGGNRPAVLRARWSADPAKALSVLRFNHLQPAP